MSASILRREPQTYNLRLKPQRLQKRKRVTLIAGFRYQYGWVLAADSQETAGDYRIEVDKVERQDLGGYECVIAGSGDTPLVAYLSRKIREDIATWEAGLSEGEIEQRLTAIVVPFHETHVRLSGTVMADGNKTPLDALLCLKPKNERKVLLWELRDTALIKPSSYSLMGWEDVRYDHEVRWLFNPGSWKNHAVLMAIRLFVMGAATSQYIKEPFRIIVADEEDGLKAFDPADVEELRRRVMPFNNALKDIVLNASDMSINEGSLVELFGVFEDRIFDLRAHFTGRTPLMRPVLWRPPSEEE